MTWHHTTVSIELLDALVATIRTSGGLVTSSKPEPEGVLVTWETPDWR